MEEHKNATHFRITKWLFRMTLIIFGAIPQLGCDSGYEETDGKITFNGNEIKDKSFVVLSKEFGKDSASAYYKNSVVEGADISSFQALDEHYAKDKNKAYYCDEHREGQNYYLTKRQTILEINQAIPFSFISAGNGYAKDSKHAFFLGKAFTVKDVASFKSLDSDFCKDDIQAYLECKPIAGSHGKSFVLLNELFTKDKNHVYFRETAGPRKKQLKILPCDAASFTLLKSPYSKDNTTVFYESKKIVGANAANFKILGDGYSKDLHNVYFEAGKLAVADVKTFELYKDNATSAEEFNYAKDKSSVFIDDKIISEADIASFKILTLGYATDNKHVFYKNTVIKDAQVATFKTLSHALGEEDAEDIFNKYLAGKRVSVNRNTGPELPHQK